VGLGLVRGAACCLIAPYKGNNTTPALRSGGGGGGGLSPKRKCRYSLGALCGLCPHREQSAHVGASPPFPRSLGCGGGGTPPKGLWPPAEPPTPCVPRVYDCALFFSALHLASGGGRPQEAMRAHFSRPHSLNSLSPQSPVAHGQHLHLHLHWLLLLLAIDSHQQLQVARCYPRLHQC
jgi:hypothetical protein